MKAPRQNPSESGLYLLVPQTVDERIQHRGHHRVEEHHHLVLLGGGGGAGLHVGNQGHAVRHGDHGEVRGAGPEGFAAPPAGADPQDGGHDAGVGQRDQAAGRQKHHHAGRHYDRLVEGDVHAGQPDERQCLTGHVVQHMAPTGGQTHGDCGLHRRVRQAHEPGDGGQPFAELQPHDGRVAQGIADGHVAIIGHGSQKQELGAPQGEREEVLGTTSGGGDGLLLQKEVRQHLGNPAGGVADVHYREVAEEEVHGQLEAGIQPDQDKDEPVAQQGQQIGGPKQEKQASLGLPVPGEAQ